MTTAKVAVYVQKAYAKRAYKRECYNARFWPGLEMICHALRSAGIEVDYCSSANVGNYKIALVSITAGIDWWSFIAERRKWRRDPGVVVAGGAGLLNVRPFLRWADVFCLGRAESYIVPLVKSLLDGWQYEPGAQSSVIYSSTFDVNNVYTVEPGVEVYPHEITLPDGKKRWKEIAFGCQRRCWFCNYTWARRNIGGLQSDAGAGNTLWAGSREKTIFELDLQRPETWGISTFEIVGLDGFSERLRKLVRKPITREMLRLFLRGLAGSKYQPSRMRIYNIVGYPTETIDDWREFEEDIRLADFGFAKIDPQWGLELNSTRFRPMPVTPCACWPMKFENFRGRIAAVLKAGKGIKFPSVFYQGNRFWSAESQGTESLPTVALDSIALRGIEVDSELVARLCADKKFLTGGYNYRMAIIEKYFPIDRLFGACTPENLPTRYLRSWGNTDRMRHLQREALRAIGEKDHA